MFEDGIKISVSMENDFSDKNWIRYVLDFWRSLPVYRAELFIKL